MICYLWIVTGYTYFYLFICLLIYLFIITLSLPQFVFRLSLTIFPISIKLFIISRIAFFIYHLRNFMPVAWIFGLLNLRARTHAPEAYNETEHAVLQGLSIQKYA